MPTWLQSHRPFARVPERAWRAIAGNSPPTAPIGIRAQRGGMDDLTAHAALGLALRIGASMLALGASGADVTATVLRVAAGYGLVNCQVDVTFTSITVSYDREGAVPLTAMRTVRTSQMDYTRLQGISDLAGAVGGGGLDVEEAHRRLDAVVSAPATYRRTVNALGWAGVAGSVGFLLGGGWLEALIAALTTALIAQVLRLLNRRSLPLFFQQAAGAALATGVAVLLLAWDVEVRSSLVVAAGIVVLLAGLSLVGAAQDAISGFPVTAAARAFEVVTLTAGIVVGIAGVLDVALRAGIPLDVVDASPTTVPFPVGLAASAGIAGGWSLACHARPRAVVLAALAGALAAGPLRRARPAPGHDDRLSSSPVAAWRTATSPDHPRRRIEPEAGGRRPADRLPRAIRRLHQEPRSCASSVARCQCRRHPSSASDTDSRPFEAGGQREHPGAAPEAPSRKPGGHCGAPPDGAARRFPLTSQGRRARSRRRARPVGPGPGRRVSSAAGRRRCVPSPGRGTALGRSPRWTGPAPRARGPPSPVR